jgi:hypothetical protein
MQNFYCVDYIPNGFFQLFLPSSVSHYLRYSKNSSYVYSMFLCLISQYFPTLVAPSLRIAFLCFQGFVVNVFAVAVTGVLLRFSQNDSQRFEHRENRSAVQRWNSWSSI